MQTASIRQDKQIAALAGDLQLRYEPQFSAANLLSLHALLPGLRGFWPMSSIDGSGNVADLSAQVRTLTNNGVSTFYNTGLAPYVKFDGAAQYLSRADESGLDILGTEAYITAPGLTAGGWWYLEDVGENSSEPLISKTNTTGNQRSWRLHIDSSAATYYPKFEVSGAGTTYVTVTHTTGIALAGWRFIAARFTPSTEIAVWIDGVKVINTTSIPASLFNSTAALQVGAQNGAAEFLNGRASLAFLCASALTDYAVFALYQAARPLFAV